MEGMCVTLIIIQFKLMQLILTSLIIGYTTPIDDENCEIDEYIIFKQVLEEAKRKNPEWYSVLTTTLTGEKQKALEDVIVLADQRSRAVEGKGL